MIKIAKILKAHRISTTIFILFSVILLLYQNCSKTNFSTVESAQQSSLASDSIDNQQFRIKVLTPDITQQANPGKIKALIVIDNSATMSQSQLNLSQNIDVLLTELSKYDADVKVVSTTFSNSSCTPGYAFYNECVSGSVFNFTSSMNSTTINGIPGTVSASNFTEKQSTTFSLKKLMTNQELSDVRNKISDKIKSFGTNGSDQESPYAVVAGIVSETSFFSQNDKALIFVVTDENDTGSQSILMNPKYSYVESATPSQIVPAVIAYFNTWGYSGQCNYYNEVGQWIKNEIIIGGGHKTKDQCEASIAGMTNCSFGGCFEKQTDVGPVIIEGTMQGSCDSLRASYENKIYGAFVKCIETTTAKYGDTIVNANIKNYFLGLVPADFEINNTNEKRTALLAGKVKTILSQKFSDKYLLSVASNIKNQSCSLKVGQSEDIFFTNLKPYFPSENFSINSICETAGQSNTAIAKMASDFINIVNSKYPLGLSSKESIVSVRIKIPDKTELIDLVSDGDYKIESNQFVLLNQNFNNFERIEINIKTSP